VPSIFTTFEQYDPKAEIGLRLLTPLTPSDMVRSVFGAYACTIMDDAQLYPNCVAKLVYRHYGVAVHQALHQALNWEAPAFAPKLHGCSSKPGIDARVYIMEYLRPPSYDTPGWLTLARVNQDMVAKKLDLIYPLLNEIVDRLANLELVHGDLRPNNLMIKMSDRIQIAEPVEIKVVDFEWADKVGTARYPQSLNKHIGYPGEPGGLIGPKDDCYMIDKWRMGVLDYVEKLHRTGTVGNNAWSPF